MRKHLFLILFFGCALNAFTQQTSNSQTGNVPQEFALVIGNGAYVGLSPLANPVNDADDMAAALESLGFTVDKVTNGSQDQMDSAVMRLKNRLSVSADAYGFFFYAGHGVQSNGENYLIPVDANIPDENYLKSRAVSLQSILDELSDARNALNVVVLDACRDNPFSWSRSGTRGLAIINRQPADSIIVYSTSAGMRASDGEGRNGLFTSRLLPNLKPGLDVAEVFNRTGADVAEVSHRQQIPAIYSQFFGKARFGGFPSDADLAGGYVPGSGAIQPVPLPASPVKNERSPEAEARLWTLGASMGSGLADPRLVGTVRGTIAPLPNFFIEPGIDLGFLSGNKDAGYFQFYPYVHAAWYYPLSQSGIYAGTGGGYLTGQYNFPEGKKPVNTFVVDFVVGGNILNIIDVSYTFKTNFTNIGHKVSVGYIYRFK